jgi:hypothetical protein
MVLTGTYEMLKMNSYHIKPGHAKLLVGNPIATTGLTTRDTEALSAKARAAIADVYYSQSRLPDLRDRHLEQQESQK